MSENVRDAQRWTPKQQRFIRFLATPSHLREEPTYEEFAKSIGIAERTLYRWKELPGLTREAADLAKDLLDDELPEIYGALRRKAVRGAFQHIKLALELAEHYTERKEVTGKNGAPLVTHFIIADERDCSSGAGG